MSSEERADLEFTRLSTAHLNDAMKIEAEAYPDPWTRTMFLQEIEGLHSYFYVAFVGPALAAYGGFWLVLDEAHLTSVTVRDSFRGHGYGRRLVDYLLEQAVSLGAKVATLEVRESNLRARNLYDSMSFRTIGIRKRYYAKTNEDAVVMLKELE